MPQPVVRSTPCSPSALRRRVAESLGAAVPVGPARPRRSGSERASTSPTSSSSTSRASRRGSARRSPWSSDGSCVHELARMLYVFDMTDRLVLSLGTALPAAKRGRDEAVDPVERQAPRRRRSTTSTQPRCCSRARPGRRPSSCACTVPAITTARPDCPFAWRVPGRRGSTRRRWPRSNAERPRAGWTIASRAALALADCFVTDPARLEGRRGASGAGAAVRAGDRGAALRRHRLEPAEGPRRRCRSMLPVDPEALTSLDFDARRARRRRWRLEAERLRSRTHQRGDAAAARGAQRSRSRQYDRVGMKRSPVVVHGTSER